MASINAWADYKLGTRLPGYPDRKEFQDQAPALKKPWTRHTSQTNWSSSRKNDGYIYYYRSLLYLLFFMNEDRYAGGSLEGQRAAKSLVRGVGAWGANAARRESHNSACRIVGLKKKISGRVLSLFRRAILLPLDRSALPYSGGRRGRAVGVEGRNPATDPTCSRFHVVTKQTSPIRLRESLPAFSLPAH